MIKHSDLSDTREPKSQDDFLPARMVNEFVYCPRLFFLEYVEGQFAHSSDTIDGAIKHRRVDLGVKPLPQVKKNGKAAGSTKSTSPEDAAEKAALDLPTLHARSVTLASDRHGILAKLDLVEATGNGATPVDYKRGRPKVGDDGLPTAWEPEQVQLCVQAVWPERPGSGEPSDEATNCSDEAERVSNKQREKPTATWATFDFRYHNRRPPRDPVNALLSLAYSVLAKELTITCAMVGLDPYLGYYHQPRYGRPALALDLMEPFRSLIAESAVLSAINSRMITGSDFVQAGDAVSLTPTGRKQFFLAFESRMDSLVTHPMFGYGRI